MKVLFATSELAPLVRVGGLAYAAAGLIEALHDAGVEVTVALPDYGTYDAGDGPPHALDMPPWVGITTYRPRAGVRWRAAHQRAHSRHRAAPSVQRRIRPRVARQRLPIHGVLSRRRRAGETAGAGCAALERLAHRRRARLPRRSCAFRADHPQPRLSGHEPRRLARVDVLPDLGVRMARLDQPPLGSHRPGRLRRGGEPTLRRGDPASGEWRGTPRGAPVEGQPPRRHPQRHRSHVGPKRRPPLARALLGARPRPQGAGSPQPPRRGRMGVRTEPADRDGHSTRHGRKGSTWPSISSSTSIESRRGWWCSARATVAWPTGRGG